MAKRYTKTTRPNAGPPGPKRQVSLAAPPREAEPRVSAAPPDGTRWPEHSTPPDSVSRAWRPSAAGPARRAPLATGRPAPGAVPSTTRRLGSRVPPALDIKEEMAFIRGDIRRMLAASGVIFLLLILLSLVLA